MKRFKSYLLRQPYQSVIPDAKAEWNQEFLEPNSERQTSRNRLHCLTTVCLLISNLVLVIALGSTYTRHESLSNTSGYTQPQMNDALKKTSTYCTAFHTSLLDFIWYLTPLLAPLLDLIDLDLHSRTFNGALRDNSSIWRQRPSPEVDAAWDEISGEKFQLITVSASDVLRSGKDPSVTLQAPISWGHGEGAYIAQIEVFHQIHCLNELRKEIYKDYYYSGDHLSEVHQSHKAHCIHMLLQALTCTSDVGIITHNWVHNERIREPKTRPMADFNVVKQCANFDKLLDWMRKAAVQDLKKKWPSLKWEVGMKIVSGEGYA